MKVVAAKAHRVRVGTLFAAFESRAGGMRQAVDLGRQHGIAAPHDFAVVSLVRAREI